VSASGEREGRRERGREGLLITTQFAKGISRILTTPQKGSRIAGAGPHTEIVTVL
jgi:hypothetical protein